MICLGQPLRRKSNRQLILLRKLQCLGKPFIGERVSEQAHGKCTISPLSLVRPCVGTIRIEGDVCLGGWRSQQRSGQRRQMIGPGRVRTGRSPHDGTEDIVEDTDRLHWESRKNVSHGAGAFAEQLSAWSSNTGMLECWNNGRR